MHILYVYDLVDMYAYKCIDNMQERVHLCMYLPIYLSLFICLYVHIPMHTRTEKRDTHTYIYL